MQCDWYYDRNTYSVHNGGSSHSCKMDSSKEGMEVYKGHYRQKKQAWQRQSHEMARNLGNLQAIPNGLGGIGAIASYVD